MSDDILTSESGQRMLLSLPAYYDKDVFKALLQTIGIEVDAADAIRDDLINQLFALTATWGLDLWENDLELSSFAGKPYDQRRSRIISKRRGIGKVCVSLLKKIAESYANGTVDVTKAADSLVFIVKFVDNLGVPPNLEDLQEALYNTIPSHMDIQYEYKYLLIKDIHEVMTINTMGTHPLTDFAPFEPVL